MAGTYSPDKHYCAYFTEVQDIEDHCVDDPHDDENATSDDGSHSAGFLNDLGVSIEDITFFEVTENSQLGDVPLTPAQRATLRRHVQTVQTVLRPHSKQQRADVRHVFTKHEPTSHREPLAHGGQKQHKDGTVPHCVTDGSALSHLHMHHNKPEVAADATLDDVYIPPPDYSDSDNLMALQSGDSPRQGKHHVSAAAASDTAESSRCSPCGVTHVDDLGRKDQKMLTTLAHLELMMLFDECNITYKRKKTRRKASDHGIFNVPLQTLLDKDRKKYPHLKVPLIFQELLQYLEKNGLHEEGLLRVSGRLTQVKELRERMDRHYSKGKPISFNAVALHNAAALLKLFLRELPEPLLMSERVNAFMQVDNILDSAKQLYALNMLILVLHEVNRNVLLVMMLELRLEQLLVESSFCGGTNSRLVQLQSKERQQQASAWHVDVCTRLHSAQQLQMLLDFLNKVIKDPANKMTAENVAMVMAPNLFLVSSGSRNRPQAMDRELKLAVATSKITLLLLANQSTLWTVPSALIDQIRQKHEDSSSNNPIMRFLGSKDKTDDVRSRISSGSGMEISVKLESTGSDVKVSIDSSTVAGDVIEMLGRSPPMQQRKLSGHQVADNTLSNSCLYEVGGNIGERRLDNCATMMSVCQVNPNAKYVLRCQQTD